MKFLKYKRHIISTVVGLVLYGMGMQITYKAWEPVYNSETTTVVTEMDEEGALFMALFWPVSLPVRVGWMTVEVLTE